MKFLLGVVSGTLVRDGVLVETKPRSSAEPKARVLEPIMSIKLVVPKVAQAREMDCWYASACMVNYYFEKGPRLGLPKVWAANKGLIDFAALAKAEGLTEVGASERLWNESNLTQILRDFGPIWCAGDWYGSGHVVVLTGVSAGMVYINDPDGGVEKIQLHAWFNTHLWKTAPCSMLRRKELV